MEWKRKSCVTAGKTWLIISFLSFARSPAGRRRRLHPPAVRKEKEKEIEAGGVDGGDVFLPFLGFPEPRGDY